MSGLRIESHVVTVASLILAVLLVLGFAGSYGLTLWAIHRSQHAWCTTLTLLTSNGPPKPGTVNYTRALTFYQHLKDLERSFRC